MINSMRGCVACDDLWLWPISSRSFGLDLENGVRSVASTVLDGFFPYLAQMVTSMRGCVAYNDLWPWPISSRSFGLGLENRVRSVASTVLEGFFPYLVQMITSMRRCVTCDDLWVIMRRLGVSSECRRSSCSSWVRNHSGILDSYHLQGSILPSLLPVHLNWVAHLQSALVN